MTKAPSGDADVAQSALMSWATHMGVASVDPVDVRRRLGEGSLPEAIAGSALRHSGSTALSIGNLTVTHGELESWVGRVASGFRRLGARPGTTVMLVARTGISEIAAYLGALRTGATVVPVGASLTATEVGHMASASGASWAAASGEGLETCRRAQMSGVAELVGLNPEDRGISTVQLEDLSQDEMAAMSLDPDAPALLAFTSGTTGRPKGAPLSHRNLLASIRGAMWAWRWSSNDHLVHSLPISHQHGLGGVHATLLAGSRATLLPRFEPEALLRTASEQGATIMFGVPAIHRRMLNRLGDQVVRLRSLRLITSGSAPLPADLAIRFEAEAGISLLERYGTTESGLNVSNPYAGPRMAGTVGLPLPGVEVAILGAEGVTTRSRDSGEVLIRGPQVFGGYTGEPSSGEPFIEGWFRTGDIGVIDEESGHLRLEGRSTDVIISGGMNVYPREVEDVIRRAPGVDDVAVVGVDSDRWGEEVVAFVTPTGVELQPIWELVARNLAAYKHPKRILTSAQLPRSPMGKVLTAELSSRALSSHDIGLAQAEEKEA